MSDRDMVSKAEVLDIYAELYDEFDDAPGVTKILHRVCDKLKRLQPPEPVVSPTIGNWIDVKERLPEDEGDVLVYGVSPRGRKKTAIMNYLAFEDDSPRWAFDGIWTVLYWMPLPEPPEPPEPPKEMNRDEYKMA